MGLAPTTTTIMPTATIYGSFSFTITAQDAEAQAIAEYRSRGYTCIGSTQPGYRTLQGPGGATAYMKVQG